MSKKNVGSKNKQLLYIFDFDGTIADFLPMIIESVREVAKKYNVEDASASEIDRIRSLPLEKIFQHFNIPLYKAPFVVNEVRKSLKSRRQRIGPVPGIIGVLRTLHDEGSVLGILTSNSKSNVVEFLRKHKIDFFDFVVSERNLFGKDKSLARLVDKKKNEFEKMLYIGDEGRDVDAAKKAGVFSVAVGWGINTPSLLESYHPDVMVSRPEELLDIRDR